MATLNILKEDTMIKKYRKKPVVVEAIQYTNESFSTIINLLDDKNADFYNEEIRIFTLEGVMAARKGDYIIKGINGEFYPCKPDIFKKIYEVVEDENI